MDKQFNSSDTYFGLHKLALDITTTMLSIGLRTMSEILGTMVKDIKSSRSMIKDIHSLNTYSFSTSQTSSIIISIRAILELFLLIIMSYIK